MLRALTGTVIAMWMLVQTALAAGNPLLGTWSAVYHGRDRYSSLLYYIYIRPIRALQDASDIRHEPEG